MPAKQAVMCWIGCVLLAAMTSGLQAQNRNELPAIFEMIPAEAQLAVVIPDLDRFNQDMATLNREMDIDIPGMNDVLDEFRRTSGMSQGINDTGGLVIAIMNVQDMDRSMQPPALMLVPISDYSEFVGNYDGDTQAAVAQLTMPWGQSVYCKQSGDFAVLSSQRSLVDGFRPGAGRIRMDMIASGIGSQYVASCDAAIVIDSRRGGEAMHALVEQFVDWFQTPDEYATRVGELQDRINQGVKGLALAGVDELMAQTEVLAVAVDMTEQGVGLAASAKFKPGSNFAQMFATQGEGTGGALQRLPNRPYLTASTLDLTAVDASSLLGAITESMQQHNVPWYAAKLEALGPLAGRANRITKVTYAPQQLSFTSRLFNEVTLIDTGDARAFAAAFQAYIDSLNGTSIDLGRLAGPDGAIDSSASPVAVSLRTQYTNAAQVINGVEVDQYVIEYNFPPQLMAALGQGAGWVMMVVGREQKGYVAPVGQTLILTNNDNPTLLSTVMAAMEQTGGIGASQPVSNVRPQLPETPIYQWYFSAADAARLFNSAVDLMGADIEQMSIDEALTPVALGVAANESGLSKRMFVPMDVLKAGQEPMSIVWGLMFPPEPTQPQMMQGQQNRMGPMGNPGMEGGYPGGVPIPGGRGR